MQIYSFGSNDILHFSLFDYFQWQMLACITYLLAIVKLSSISCFLFNFDTESGSCKVLMGPVN